MIKLTLRCPFCQSGSHHCTLFAARPTTQPEKNTARTRLPQQLTVRRKPRTHTTATYHLRYRKKKKKTPPQKHKMVKPYKRFQSQCRVKKKKKKAYRCSKLNTYRLIGFLEQSTLIFVVLFCRPTVTLHQGQGDRNEPG